MKQKSESIEILRRDLKLLQEDIIVQKRLAEKSRQAAIHIATSLQKLCRATTEGKQT